MGIGILMSQAVESIKDNYNITYLTPSGFYDPEESVEFFEGFSFEDFTFVSVPARTAVNYGDSYTAEASYGYYIDTKENCLYFALPVPLYLKVAEYEDPVRDIYYIIRFGLSPNNNSGNNNCSHEDGNEVEY